MKVYKKEAKKIMYKTGIPDADWAINHIELGKERWSVLWKTKIAK